MCALSLVLRLLTFYLTLVGLHVELLLLSGRLEWGRLELLPENTYKKFSATFSTQHLY